MEDDDEFGDLYTDVLSTFPSSSSALPTLTPTPTPTPITSASVSNPSLSRSIDLNLQSDGSEFATTNSLKLKLDIDENQLSVDEKDSNATLNLNLNSNSKRVVDNVEDSNNLGSDTRVLQTADLNLDLKQEVAVEDDAKDAVDHNDVDKEHKFGIEEDLGSEPLIPGISNVSDTVAAAAKPVGGGSGSGGGGGDDWDSDSDSEDDLQIVLNDTHHGPMGMEANGGRTVGSDDDEDEDGEPLVIVADDDAATAGGLQAAEEHDWGDEAGQTGEGKESGVDGAKANAGVSSAPKVGYSNYGYHPFHSQFKVSSFGVSVTLHLMSH